jgi:hypothetical protein
VADEAEVTTQEIVRAVEQDAPAMTAHALVMSDDEMRRSWKIAKSLAESGMFKTNESGGTTPAQAFTKMLVGRELGLNPAQAMTGIYLVKGNLQIASVTLASFVRRHREYDYKIVEHTGETCSIEFLRRMPAPIVGRPTWETLGVSTFTLEDARSAELVKPGSAWAKHPRNMLFARAMSNGVKWYMPDLLGGMPVYTEGDAFVDSTAEVMGAGEGDGSSRGLDLGPDVDAVIARAAALPDDVEFAHPWLADRASVEVKLGGQSPQYVDEFVQWANRELEAVDVSDADVVEPEGTDVAQEAAESPAAGQGDVEAGTGQPAPVNAESVASLEAQLSEALDARDAQEAAGYDDGGLLAGKVGELEAELAAARDADQGSLL